MTVTFGQIKLHRHQRKTVASFPWSAQELEALGAASLAVEALSKEISCLREMSDDFPLLSSAFAAHSSVSLATTMHNAVCTALVEADPDTWQLGACERTQKDVVNLVIEDFSLEVKTHGCSDPRTRIAPVNNISTVSQEGSKDRSSYYVCVQYLKADNGSLKPLLVCLGYFEPKDWNVGKSKAKTKGQRAKLKPRARRKLIPIWAASAEILLHHQSNRNIAPQKRKRTKRAKPKRISIPLRAAA